MAFFSWNNFAVKQKKSQWINFTALGKLYYLPIFREINFDYTITLSRNIHPFCNTEKTFRQINSLVISLVNPLLSRNFRQKMERVNCRNFHTLSQCGKTRNSLTKKIFRQINVFTEEVTKKMISRFNHINGECKV